MDHYGFPEEHRRIINAETSASLLPKDKPSPRASSRSNVGEKGHPASLRQRVLCDTWFYEDLAIFVSIACLTAIAVVLSVYNQRPAPQLKYGLTLNAIISILATGSKAGLIFVVASCTSQLKWYWIQKGHRPLRDLQLYDDASRGFSGAIMLLFTRAGRSIASIGALITILAVTFDPFVQQLLAYPIRTVPKTSSLAMTKQAAVFSVPGDDAGAGDSFISAVNAGIWGHSSQFARNPICTSGNCTWPPYRSVEWCSQCEDITSSVSVSGCNFTGTFTRHKDYINNSRNHSWYDVRRKTSCGLSLGKGAPVDLSFWGSAQYYRDNIYDWVETTIPKEAVWAVQGIDEDDVSATFSSRNDSVVRNITFNGVERPLMVFARASLEHIDEKHPPKGIVVSRGEQCVLSLCEKTYQTSVSNGVLSSVVLSTKWGGVYYWDFDLNRTIQDSYVHIVDTPEGGHLVQMYWAANPMETDQVFFHVHGDYIPGYGYYTDPAHSAFTLGATWYESIASRIKGSVTAEWILGGQTMEYNNGTVIKSGWESGNLVKYSSDTMKTIVDKGLSEVISNIAASLTGLGLDRSNMTVPGTTSVSEVYIDVRWKWLVLPCLLELAGIAFLITTILASRYQEVRTWKSSKLSMHFYTTD